MNDTSTKPPLWYWIVVSLALIWNLMGAMNFFMQLGMTEEVIAKLPEAEQELYKNIPLYSTISFAVSVIAGTVGCILLLLRRKWALPVFILSLVGIVILFGHWLFLSEAIDVYGASTIIMPAVVTLIGVGLIGLTLLASKSNWLK